MQKNYICLGLEVVDVNTLLEDSHGRGRRAWPRVSLCLRAPQVRSGVFSNYVHPVLQYYPPGVTLLRGP
jgi:hypothetical protein